MSNWDTGQDLLSDVLFRASEPTDGSSDYVSQAKKYIQDAYWITVKYAPWKWALVYPPGVFQTLLPITGSATVTLNSATITLSASIANSVAGYKFMLSSESTPYRIATHTAGSTTLTLDVPYVGTLAGASVNFTIFQDEYSLSSSIIKPFRWWLRDRPYPPVNFISPEELQDKVQSQLGVLEDIAIIRENPCVVLIRRVPDVQQETIEYDYVTRPAQLTFDGVASTDTPIVPSDDRIVIAHIALGMLGTDKEMGQKANTALTLAKGRFDRMMETYFPPVRRRMWISSRRALGSA